MSYVPTIGLEIHAELKTNTKMFCDSKNDPNESKPNVNVCPVCMGHPGTLPTINKEAVRSVLRVGLALKGRLADYTEFDRKNYFYPDIPKGFQISQYKHPLVAGGSLNSISITRVHLEEDTARSQHAGTDTLIDYNRAGLPLMELVTEPVIRSAEEAAAFARELQLLLRTLLVSDANLEKGEMRIEANVSISNTDALGTKVEIKNLNSFRSVERSILYEVSRQEELLKKGEKVVQETRGWDEIKEETVHQRKKEGSADYRYFPEPDLPKIVRSEIPELRDEVLKEQVPELPWEKRIRYQTLGIKAEDIEYILATRSRNIFFDAVLTALQSEKVLAQLATNYMTSDLAGFAKEESDVFEKVSPEAFSTLIRMVKDEKLSSRGAKDLLSILVTEGGDPTSLAEKKGLIQVNDEAALLEIVLRVIAENPKVVAEYHSGKEASIGYLIGASMKESGGSANPQVLRKLLLEKLTV